MMMKGPDECESPMLKRSLGESHFFWKTFEAAVFLPPNIPIGSMYAIFTHLWSIFMVNVVKYNIHGSYGI